MDRYKKTRFIVTLSLAANIALAVMKLIAGVASRSSAMTADGLNSAGDVVNSIIALWGNALSQKPKDDDHPYGHGKAEYIFAGVIGLALLLVAWSTLQNSVQSLMNARHVEHVPILMAVAAATIATKISLAMYSSRTGKSSKNPLLLALAQDHSADVFVTLGTVIGILCSRAGLYWMDGTVGILISAWIARSGVKVLRDSYSVLMDTEAKSSPLISKAEQLIKSIEEIDHIDAIHARPVGSRFAIVIKISVPGAMTVAKSHEITRLIKDPLMEIEEVADVTVHVNPMEEHVGPSVL